MSERAELVIALTGLPSSGKGEVAAALAELAAARDIGSMRLVFSDQIKAEARRRGITDERFTREILSEIGTQMRDAEGPGVLAQRIADTIRSCKPPRPRLFIADGARHIGEVEALRKAFGDRFILAAVESEPREIARRLIARRRCDESPEAMQSEEKAIALLELELTGRNSKSAPNVGSCMEVADVRIPNHGTLDALKQYVHDWGEALLREL